MKTKFASLSNVSINQLPPSLDNIGIKINIMPTEATQFSSSEACCKCYCNYWSIDAKERNYEKYEAATNFSYTLDKIGSTPERRQRIFKAEMKGLFD